jgi:NAD(P)H-hydrate epimerase
MVERGDSTRRSQGAMTGGFYGPTGIAIPAVGEEQMREVDRIAIEETGPNLFQMMENAGRSLAITALEMMVKSHRGPVVVLAGTGGNGGGGITAARHLANHGLEVVVAVSDEAGLGEVAAFQLRVFEATGGRHIYSSDLEGLSPALVIDALIGYSLRNAPRGIVAEMIGWAGKQESPILALDLPSGIDATTGHAPGTYIAADTTMTLALPKRGLVNEAAGSLVLADLGIPVQTYRRAGVLLQESPFGDRFRIPLQRS